MRSMIFSDIKLSVEKDEKELFSLVQKKFGKRIETFTIKKKSLDARDKNNLRYVYTVEVSDTLKQTEPALERLSKERCPQKPILIVGSGPAGLFCAIRLIERGIRPILIERGASVEERERKMNTFFSERKLDVDSNVQFGEGGAGTFSDGKLNTQTHSALNGEVLKTFVRFGAPEEILWLQKPHIGSDNLKKVVQNMRAYILKMGGEVRFHTRLSDLKIQNGVLQSAVLVSQKGEETIDVSTLILAIGHSARDTFKMLERRGIPMKQKDFAVGVRIEHLQSEIGFSQYGKGYAKLPPADYKLVSHASERSAFTFCMCPGGYVMPATSEEGAVVTNGMSNYARNNVNANSALIAQVSRADFADDSPLAGVRFQQELERSAFLAGGGNYNAPIQLVGDFLDGRASARFGEVQPTYAVGTTFCDLKEVLPLPIINTLQLAIKDMDRRLKGFANPYGILTAVESRTSSPIRIERGEEMYSVGAQGLYPCGEGAGYAGGITSSAADGLRIAECIYQKLLFS